VRLTHLLPALALAACSRGKAPEWPDFPQDAGALAALVEARTVRPPPTVMELTPEAVFAEASRQGWASLPSGQRAIDAWVDAALGHGPGTAWLLVGTFHDSAGQVAAFHRLTAPGGVPGLTHLVLEQLRADGRWQHVTADQRGDSAALAEYLRLGTPEAFAALARAHEEHDYTGWKYGYAAELLDVVTSARAQGVSVSGCDLPAGLLPLAGALGEGALRLRELHCLLAFRAAQPAASRVAMLWGQAHVRADGLRRYLPPSDAVLALVLFGARHSADAPDELLRARLLLADPVLVPLGKGEAALLLPDAWLGADVDRVRGRGEVKALGVLRASAATAGTLRVGAAAVELTAWTEVALPLAPGDSTFCFTPAEGPLVVGALEVPARGEVELFLDPAARSTRVRQTLAE